MKRMTSSRFVVSLAALLLLTGFPTGCARKTEPAQQPTAVQSPKPQTPFERDLEYVRTGQFTYILIFSRKDGAVFANDDISYLKANSPQETNQWVSTEGGRRIIAGTNFEFKQEHFDALNTRFVIENLSGK